MWTYLNVKLWDLGPVCLILYKGAEFPNSSGYPLTSAPNAFIKKKTLFALEKLICESCLSVCLTDILYYFVSINISSNSISFNDQYFKTLSNCKAGFFSLKLRCTIKFS